jgi:Na+/melibiose symporter-like transporter
MSYNVTKGFLWILCAAIIGSGLALFFAPYITVGVPKDRLDMAVIIGGAFIVIGLTFFLLSIWFSIRQDRVNLQKQEEEK